MVNVKRPVKWLAKGGAAKKKKALSKPSVVGLRPSNLQGGRLGAPLSPILKTRFRVVDSGGLNGGAAGAIATGTYQLNNLFDPTAAIGANQPRGFDQLALLYGKYRVRYAKINMQVVNSATTAAAMASSVIVGIMITNSATAPTNFREAIEHGYCVWECLPCSQDAKSNLTEGVDVAKFKQRNIEDDELTAVVTGAPSDLLYAHCFVQAIDQTTDLNLMGYVVTIDFWSDMLEPITVAAS